MTTFVLVPGAWLGGWVWARIVLPIEQRGHKVYPVTLTGMGDRVHLASKDYGIETAIQDVLSVVKYESLEEVVLVGHSFAGKVVAAVGDRIPEKVKKILYLDAYRPAKNVRKPQGAFDPTEFGKLDPGQWTIPFTEQILDAIGKDVKGRDRGWLLSKGTPWPRRFANEPVTLSEKFDSLESAYVFCTGGGDDVQEILKEKLDGPYRVIESGHYPMVTKPAELTDAILELAG